MAQKVACANGISIKKTSNNIPKPIPKSMKIRYKFHARKKSSQKMENHQTNNKK